MDICISLAAVVIVRNLIAQRKQLQHSCLQLDGYERFISVIEVSIFADDRRNEQSLVNPSVIVLSGLLRRV